MVSGNAALFEAEVTAQSVKCMLPKHNTVAAALQTTSPKQLLTAQGVRLDGRSFDQFRNTYMKTGVIKGARGSAYVELNGTKVMCAVYGPKQLTQEFSEVGRLQVDVQLAAFARDQQLQHGYSAGDRSGAAAVAAQMQQEQVREALQTVVCLDKIPKSVIEVNLFVLEDDGGATGAAISCSSLALADAGVEMVDLVAACSASELENGNIVVDPTALEERYATGGVLCAYMASLNEVTQVMQYGDMQFAKVTEAIELCCDGCAKLQELMKQTLIQEKQQSEHNS